MSGCLRALRKPKKTSKKFGRSLGDRPWIGNDKGATISRPAIESSREAEKVVWVLENHGAPFVGGAAWRRFTGKRGAP